MYNVMHNFTRPIYIFFQTILAKTINAFDIQISRCLPFFTIVKSFCKFSSHSNKRNRQQSNCHAWKVTRMSVRRWKKKGTHEEGDGMGEMENCCCPFTACWIQNKKKQRIVASFASFSWYHYIHLYMDIKGQDYSLSAMIGLIAARASPWSLVTCRTDIWIISATCSHV